MENEEGDVWEKSRGVRRRVDCSEGLVAGALKNGDLAQSGADQRRPCLRGVCNDGDVGIFLPQGQGKNAACRRAARKRPLCGE